MSCVQCNERQCFKDNTGHVHPYCGRTCANAFAAEAKAKAMCKHCHERQCFKDNTGHVHPYCGRTCANAFASAKANTTRHIGGGAGGGAGAITTMCSDCHSKPCRSDSDLCKRCFDEIVVEKIRPRR